MTPEQPKTRKHAPPTVQPVLCANGRYKSIRLTRKLAMACFCTECLGFDSNPSECTSLFCPLYPFRARTYRTREGDLTKSEARLLS